MVEEKDMKDKKLLVCRVSHQCDKETERRNNG